MRFYQGAALLLLCSLVTLTCSFLAANVSAAVLVNDQFVDGDFSNGTDTSDIAWYALDNAATPTIQSDSTTGPNEGSADNAIQWARSGATNFASIGGSFAPTTLAIGDTLTLTLDARFTSAATANAGGFRIGIYNTNGGTTGGATGQNDFGYVMRTTSGTAAGTNTGLGKETGTDGIIVGGTDITNVAVYNSVVGLNTTSRNFTLSMTRTALNTITFGFVIDGVTYSSLASGALSDTSASNFTFDEIVFATGNVAQTLRVDNVSLNYTAVPEPSISILGGLGLGAFCLRRRRSSSNRGA